MCLTKPKAPNLPPPPAPVAVPRLKDPVANAAAETAQAAGTRKKAGLQSLRIDRAGTTGLNVPKG